MTDRPRRKRPSGTGILNGKDGPQLIRSSGKRWSDAAEAVFLDHLAATCNVRASAAACGFSGASIYYRKRNHPAFAARWRAALEVGYAHLEALLLQRALEALEGFAPDPEIPVTSPTYREARELLGRHKASVEGGAPSRRNWARPRSLDELSESILRKLEAIAPAPLPALPAAG